MTALFRRAFWLRAQRRRRTFVPLMRVTTVVGFLTLLAFPAAVRIAAAQTVPAAANATVDSTARLFQLAGRTLVVPPRIDGVIDTAEWAEASVIRDLIQYAPRRGSPASQPTEVRVAYDTLHLYVAFRVRDDGPPTAQITRRDAELLDDDAVIVLLDTYRDRQSAYYFVVNALGTQGDGRVADDGRVVDASWDAAWRAAARQTGNGWEAEIAIPFASLAFRPGLNQSWGVNFGRTRRRTLEQSFWAGPLDNLYRISQAGELSALDLRPPAKRYQLIAYGLSRAEENSRAQWDAGLDARYALTPQMALTATLNPDFATIESDRQQVNLTRFELSLPEKRPFFLEGSELYRQRIQTFYSRRIADIRGGAKVFGKQGPWTLAATYADAEPFSGTRNPARYTVARVQRSVFGRSNVAVMLADRDTAGMHAGSTSTDATLFFTKTLGMTGQWIRSHGAFDDGTTAWFLRPSYDTPTGHFHVRYTDLGERFADNANAVGFIRDDDRREFDSAIEKTLLPRAGVAERVEYNSNYNIFHSQAGRLRSWEIRQSLDVDLRNRFSLGVGRVEDLQRFEKDFRNWRNEATIGYNTREFQSVQVGYSWGYNFDSRLRLLTAQGSYKLTPALSVEYEIERLTLDPDPDDETTWIHVARVNQFFTPDLFLRLFAQTATVTDRRDVQAVFVYRYRPPFGTIQLAFQRGDVPFGDGLEQRNTFFLKTTAVF